MKSYKVTAFGAPLEARDEPTPVPGGTEVVLRVEACGVCHSDLHIWDGYFDMGGGRKADIARTTPLPLVLGHEIAGEVVAIGPGATGVEIGDRRVVYPWIGCGECAFCVAGDEHICARPRALGVNVDGGFADHLRIPHPRYLLDFGDLPATLACTYACSGLTAYSALNKVKDQLDGGGLLIIGAGGVGISAVRLARQVTGVDPVVADIDAAKRAAALDAGAAEAVDPLADGAARALLKSTGGGVAAAIDFVGAPASARFGFDVLARGGTLVVVGLFGGAFEAPLPHFPFRLVTVTGSMTGSLAEMRALMDLAKAGAVAPIPIETRDLDRAEETLRDLRAGRIGGRAVLRV